jgi:allantoinase
MADFDVIIRGGVLVRETGLDDADIGISDGKIAAIAAGLGAAHTEIAANGLHVLPGVVDVHVHFNEPGRTDWEGVASGSQAFAAGAGTTFVDMPLNSSPVTTTASAFDLKLAAMQASSLTDFALWGGLVPGNLEHLAALAERGAVGFKAFMSNSGLEEFGAADDLTLFEGMREAARLGLPMAVHAESDAITGALSKRMLDAGRNSIRDFLDSRPVVAELEAISRAIVLAEETGCALHVVHISSGRGVALAAEAKARGVNVSIETCPHYLAFTEDDLERLGAVLKCTPPVRDTLEFDRLWDEVLTGRVDIVGSDHSPAPPSMKTDSDFFRIWGGISGVQSSLNVLLSEGHHGRGLALEAVARMLSGNPARRFGLASKGALEVGFDADMALVALNETWTLQTEHLEYRHQQSPYLHRKFTGRVRRTILRGRSIWQNGAHSEMPSGQLVRPKLER